jgi:hypothetical protein
MGAGCSVDSSRLVAERGVSQAVFVWRRRRSSRRRVAPPVVRLLGDLQLTAVRCQEPRLMAAGPSMGGLRTKNGWFAGPVIGTWRETALGPRARPAPKESP